MFRHPFKHQISLLTIITIIIMLCMMTPLIITCSYFYAQLKNNVYATMEKDLSTSAEKSFSLLDSNLLAIKNTYYTIISDPIINPQLYGDISNYQVHTLTSSGAIDDRLNKMMFFCTVWNEKVLSSVALFNSIDSYHYIDNAQYGKYMDKPGLNALQGVTKQWNTLAKSIDENKRINMFFHSDENSDSIYYIRDFYNYSSGTFKGLVSFQIKESSIMKCFDEFNKYRGSLCLLYDSDGNIIASNKFNTKDNTIQNTSYNNISINSMMADNRNYIVKTSSLANFNLTASILIPLKPVKQQLFKQLQYYLLIFVVLFICVIFIAIVISRFITQYIDILMRRMSAVRNGDYTQTIPVYGITEIDNLSTAFCEMSAQIKKLLEEIYANEVLLKESELKALQAQINPHFLFNTLLSIGFKTRANGDMESFEMITALSSLLNANIYTSDTKFISIREEIQNVTYYLMIQKSRFGNHISYDIDIAPELLDIPILKLSIQPIVENAVVHGLENKVGDGHILIEGSLSDNEILIKIIDNGVGFNPEKLEKDMDSYRGEKKQSGHHIGLLNTDLRMKYTYGKQYGLIINSTVGKGTTVLIKYPIERRL